MVAVKSDIEAPAVTQEIPHDHLYKVTGLTNLEKLAQGVCKGYPNCVFDIQQEDHSYIILFSSSIVFLLVSKVTRAPGGIGDRAGNALAMLLLLLASIGYGLTISVMFLLVSMVTRAPGAWEGIWHRVGNALALLLVLQTSIGYGICLPSELPAADFEDAISATGYGWFNVGLMLRTLPAFWSSVSVTSAASYIFTRAQCDMNLRLLDMGTVTAMTYIGMISSAVIWGFLSDTLGRKKFLVWGFFCSGLVEIAAALSQNFTMLLVTRFMSGFLFNGPFAVLFTYIAELHRTDLRARVLLLTGLFFTIASTTLPLLAWATMLEDWDYTIFGNFVIHSWNIFLLATALVPLLTGVAFLSLPESPKFLMSRGRNEEALEVFRKIYSSNTGKPPETFPITKLVEERPEQSSRGLAALKEGRFQFTPLFKVPHLTWLLLVCGAHLGCMFGSNTIRLWYPQLAAMVGSDGSEDLCAAIAPQTELATERCSPIETDVLTYLQSAVVGAGSVVTYCIGGALINRCGKKIVPGVSGIFSAVFIVMLPLIANSALTMTALVTTALALTSLCSASLSSIAVDLFPTSLRVMAMALFLMTGRIGTILGTVIFPALINFGCLPPFIAISAVLSLCGLTCFFLPNTTLKKLE